MLPSVVTVALTVTVIQDKEQPDTEDHDLNSVPFNAALAIDDPAANDLAEQPGADGFRMDSTPLFQVISLFIKMF